MQRQTFDVCSWCFDKMAQAVISTVAKKRACKLQENSASKQKTDLRPLDQVLDASDAFAVSDVCLHQIASFQVVDSEQRNVRSGSFAANRKTGPATTKGEHSLKKLYLIKLRSGASSIRAKSAIIESHGQTKVPSNRENWANFNQMKAMRSVHIFPRNAFLQVLRGLLHIRVIAGKSLTSYWYTLLSRAVKKQYFQEHKARDEKQIRGQSEDTHHWLKLANVHAVFAMTLWLSQWQLFFTECQHWRPLPNLLVLSFPGCMATSIKSTGIFCCTLTFDHAFIAPASTFLRKLVRASLLERSVAKT